MPDSAHFGPYRLQGEIGRGAMGVVYRAYDERHARVVALKVLSPDISSDTEYRHRFEQESHIVAALTDPHVIPIHSYGEIDQQLYLDMRLVQGRSVKEWLRDSGPMSPTQAVSIVSQVADALDSAHADGVIHRDVKPSNVLIARHVASRHGRDEFAYLVDFGIARSLGGTGMTSIGFTVGTIDYMAPERFDGQKSGVGADVYALGCLLVECLTGRKPFPGVEVAQVVRGHLHSPPPRPSLMVPGVPAGFDAVVAKAMDKQPGDRYHSAGELADDARSVLSAGGFGAGPYRAAGPPPPGRGFDAGLPTSNAVPAFPVPTGALPNLAGPSAGPSAGPVAAPGAGPGAGGSSGGGPDVGRPVPFAPPALFTGPATDSSGPRQLGTSGPPSRPPALTPPPPPLTPHLLSPPAPPPAAPTPPPAAPPRGRGPDPASSGPHGIPISTARRDRKVIVTAACAAVLIVVAGIVAVIVHNNSTAESCAAGSTTARPTSILACGQTSPSAGTTGTTGTTSAAGGLSDDEKTAVKAIGADAVCTSASTKLAPAAQAAYVDAAVTCPTTVPGVANLYAFHLKSAADTSSALRSLSNYGLANDSYGYDSFLNRFTGKVAQGTWATTYATAPQFILVWPTFKVEVVAVSSSPTASAENLVTSLRTVSWQYGNFGGAPDYGSQATLRSYTKLTSCAPHRLEEIAASEYLLNVAWLVCSAPKTQPSFTSIQLFRVDTAAHAKADLKHVVDQGYAVIKTLKGADGATGQCVASRGSLATVTSIFCQYPSISGYDQVHLESQLQTTMTFSATKRFFTTHSIDLPTLFNRV